jgi:hypothetical protein
MCRVSNVVYMLYSCTYNEPPSDAARMALHANDEDWYPFVFLQVDFFHQALQHCYHGATRVQQESFQFELAKTLVHELAHVWTAFCHPESTSGGAIEPLAFLCDAFPEAGFSWEQFTFGANLGPSRFEDVLLARTFASQFRAPHHHLTSYVPQTYVSQWFLQSTWDHFEQLYGTGRLFAPSPDHQTSQFQLIRFCKTKKKAVTTIYLNGYVASLQRCCREPICGMANPSSSVPWPSDPADLFAKYMDIMQHDIKAANAMGVEYDPVKLEKDRVPESYAREATKMDAFEYPNRYRVACGVISALPEQNLLDKGKRIKPEKPLSRLEMWLFTKYMDLHRKRIAKQC